jgi:hypothetical protein
MTLAVTPTGLLIQPVQAIWDEPLPLVFSMPYRPYGFIHHRIATDD